MSASTTNVRFIIGSRQLFAVPRRLETVSHDLDQLLGRCPAQFPTGLDKRAHGLRILSAPVDAMPQILAGHPDYIMGGYQAYRRHYIDMSAGFVNYMAHFSNKTRSTLRRKRRKLEERCGGALDIREYRSPAEMSEFLDHALPLSRLTYQARLLCSGLPEGKEHRTGMLALAEADCLRAYILFMDGKAASYLYLPIHDGIVIYEHLGYDPALSGHSPGTILQMEALERLFAESRYRYFDFTEGDGPHKALFATASVEACSFFLLKRSISNRALLSGLSAFNGWIGALRNFSSRYGLDRHLRSALRN